MHEFSHKNSSHGPLKINGKHQYTVPSVVLIKLFAPLQFIENATEKKKIYNLIIILNGPGLSALPNLISFPSPFIYVVTVKARQYFILIFLEIIRQKIMGI